MAVTKKTPKKVDKALCQLTTPEFRVSYPHVFKPNRVKPDDDAKYSITMLFPKGIKLIGLAPAKVEGGPREKRSIKEVITNAKIAKFGPEEDWPENIEEPVTDGDDPKYANKEGYKGHWVMKATTNEEYPPGVYGPDLKPLTEANQLQPGCYAYAFIYAHVWEYMNKQGVRFILDHVQKSRDGKSFGNRKSVEQVFSPIEAPDDSNDGPADEDEDMDFT